LFSFPTTLSAPSHPLSPHAFTYPSHPPPTCYHTTLPPTHSATNILYQLYTTPNPCNPLWCKNPTPQQQKYTQTHTEPQNPANPTSLPPLTHLPPISPFSATLTNFSNFCSCTNKH
jgi:hypothetical protein